MNREFFHFGIFYKYSLKFVMKYVINMYLQGLPELADQNDTVKSLSSGNNRKNI
jgi:hypothetical protein